MAKFTRMPTQLLHNKRFSQLQEAVAPPRWSVKTQAVTCLSVSGWSDTPVPSVCNDVLLEVREYHDCVSVRSHRNGPALHVGHGAYFDDGHIMVDDEDRECGGDDNDGVHCRHLHAVDRAVSRKARARLLPRERVDAAQCSVCVGQEARVVTHVHKFVERHVVDKVVDQRAAGVQAPFVFKVGDAKPALPPMLPTMHAACC